MQGETTRKKLYAETCLYSKYLRRKENILPGEYVNARKAFLLALCPSLSN